MEKYDFSGWATRNDLLCVDGRTIKKDAFKNQNGETVPLVWGHTHSDPNRVLGHAVLENRDEGVYAYCSFNDSESGLAAKKLVKHGDVRSLSICAGQLKQAGANVVHGVIYELSLVLAGANPGAFIDSVMEHGDASEDRMIIGYDENIMIYHSADEKEEKSETQEGKTSEEKTEEDEETVEQIFDTLSEKQKNVIYAMFGQAFGEPDKPEDKNDDSKGGKTEMNYLALKVDSDSQDAVVTVELVGGTKGPVTLDEDRNIVLLIKNKDTQSIKVTVNNEGNSSTKTYKLTGLTLEGK